MAKFEAAQMSLLWLIIPAAFMVVAIGFIVSGMAIAAGILLAGFMLLLGYLFMAKRRITTYNVDDSGISAEGSGKKIPIGEIVDVRLMTPQRGFLGRFRYEGGDYARNTGMISGAMPLMPLSEMVQVYTTNTDNVLNVRNCYLLTPKDSEGFIKEARGRMKKSKKAVSP